MTHVFICGIAPLFASDKKECVNHSFRDNMYNVPLIMQPDGKRFVKNDMRTYLQMKTRRWRSMMAAWLGTESTRSPTLALNVDHAHDNRDNKAYEESGKYSVLLSDPGWKKSTKTMEYSHKNRNINFCKEIPFCSSNIWEKHQKKKIILCFMKKNHPLSETRTERKRSLFILKHTSHIYKICFSIRPCNLVPKKYYVPGNFQ